MATVKTRVNGEMFEIYVEFKPDEKHMGIAVYVVPDERPEVPVSPKVKEAMEWLERNLDPEVGGDKIEASLLIKTAIEEGVSETALRKAKKKLGIESNRSSWDKGGGGWYWRLPSKK